jgi:hypothetical protein
MIVSGDLPTNRRRQMVRVTRYRKNTIISEPGDFVTQVSLAGGRYFLVHDTFESLADLRGIRLQLLDSPGYFSDAQLLSLKEAYQAKLIERKRMFYLKKDRLPDKLIRRIISAIDYLLSIDKK